jgi:organic hydroperoxide reductase OsmC/OhrA
MVGTPRAWPTPLPRPIFGAMTPHSYLATVRWVRGAAPFTDLRYSRAHEWRFDGGVIVPASSSPHVVPEPYSLAGAVDPEEAFVASLSSCHMLWTLSHAAKAGWVIDEYVDDATGEMTRNAGGKLAMTRVTLRPALTFSGDTAPTEAEHAALHHRAHEDCFIASSVRSTVECIPSMIRRPPPSRSR